MAKLTTESPICRRIVRSFLDFLDSVEPSSGVDEEGLEVARDCLIEAFKLNPHSTDDPPKTSVSLIDLFSSLENNDKRDNSDITEREVTIDGPSSSSAPNHGSPRVREVPKPLVEDSRKEPQSSGFSKDELFGQFFAALEKIDFFRTMSDGNEDASLVDKATHVFHDAIHEMEKFGCQTFDVKNLAETLKSQGNKAMQSKLYLDAIELYTFAIALWEKNAVFYCNRAAAYTQINRYTEAINDCLKSIEVDPNYSKAYSRLGLAYYAQGNYTDAIERGFKKALQLDPNNESVKENIRVAEQKLREAQHRTGHAQVHVLKMLKSEVDTKRINGDATIDLFELNTGDNHNHGSNRQSTGGSRGQGSIPSFSMPFDASGLPVDFTNMFMNVANMFPGQASNNNQREGGGNSNGTDSEEPGIRVNGNINLDFGDGTPGDISGALRSMMGMFGASAQGNNNPQRNTPGGPNGNSS